MPIFMDRHEIPKEISAEHVAQMHKEDMKIEHLYNCKGMTYWCDEKRHTAFCLIEAPNKEAIQKMHNHAHGDFPHSIIEVDDAIVESFLGRIADPKVSKDTELNIIKDPAFRIIMVISIKKTSFENTMSHQLISDTIAYTNSIIISLEKFRGRIVKQKSDYFLCSFKDISNAVLCALEIQKGVNKTKKQSSSLTLNIGLSAGAPVTEKDSIFEDTIRMAERLCDNVKGQIAMTSEVKDLFESENLKLSIDDKIVKVLNTNSEKFLNMLMDYTENEWYNPTLSAEGLSKHLGYSKSQLYRKMIANTGTSPNTFIKEYRLGKALNLLNKQADNISEVAFKTGFNSPAYFSKCFQETYGILPSKYIQQYI
ncbi:AraC-like DNA-binding protein [Saonia flava]|uniref:AraC-like DNA-binding protein n=1 Tax=Saonia flava TaxID=523696 RepID=A0A846QX96_9FLAO|nr:nickel-binding protein [Saonia flava]NJB70255.1 AraC-like DNA-binding protein [Saonia flava]